MSEESVFATEIAENDNDFKVVVAIKGDCIVLDTVTLDTLQQLCRDYNISKFSVISMKLERTLRSSDFPVTNDALIVKPIKVAA